MSWALSHSGWCVPLHSPPPLIMSSGEALLESAGKRPVDAANRALGEVFALITLPFTCFTLFLHHLIRYLCYLQSLEKKVLHITLAWGHLLQSPRFPHTSWCPLMAGGWGSNVNNPFGRLWIQRMVSTSLWLLYLGKQRLLRGIQHSFANWFPNNF